MVATSERLVDLARERTGLSDFGPDGWQEGMTQLLAAAQADLGTDPAAVQAIEALAVRRLINRLRIEQWYVGQADCAIPPVEGPVVIVGLPRTATTALHYLLAVDPQFRYPRGWEIGDPVPPPDVATESADPRRLAATARTDDVRHISAVDGPMEDIGALGLHFHNQELGLPLPTYTRWWRGADLASTFGYHERVLRLLHSHRPPYRWLVKAPAYLFQTARLAKQYPNAKFLMTHRDPVRALPSACSVVRDAQQNALPNSAQDPSALGRDLLEHFAEGTQRAIADRRELGEDRFLDIGQPEFERDPLPVVERIYQFLGLQLADEVRAAMSRWTVENRRGARGEHKYAAQDFGLDDQQIRAAFAGYLDEFADFIT